LKIAGQEKLIKAAGKCTEFEPMHMTLRQIFALCMLLLLAVGNSCKGDPTSTKKPAPDSNSIAADSQRFASSATPTASKTEGVSPSAQKKHFSIDTSRNENQAVYKKDRTGNIPAPATEKTLSRPPGVAGYITRDNVLLQTEPVSSASKISTLKKNEIVYIVETIMTDEKGQVTEYPTWYQVERKNKQRGWVLAKSVVAGGGG